MSQEWRDVAYDGAGVAVPGVQVGVRVVFGDAPHALPFVSEGRPARVFVPEAGAPRGVLGGGQASHGVPALAWRARSKVEGPVPDTNAAVALICRAMSPELDPANHRAPSGEYRVADGVAAPSPLQAMAAAGPADHIELSRPGGPGWRAATGKSRSRPARRENCLASAKTRQAELVMHDEHSIACRRPVFVFADPPTSLPLMPMRAHCVYTCFATGMFNRSLEGKYRYAKIED